MVRGKREGGRERGKGEGGREGERGSEGRKLLMTTIVSEVV